MKHCLGAPTLFQPCFHFFSSLPLSFLQFSAYKRKHGNEVQNVQNGADAIKSCEPEKKKEKVDPEYREFLEAQGVKDKEVRCFTHKKININSFIRIRESKSCLLVWLCCL